MKEANKKVTVNDTPHNGVYNNNKHVSMSGISREFQFL